MRGAAPPSRRIPRATYRLQLHAGFAFADVRRVLPYLETLGVSDVYLSPIFMATPGSTHGYDVVDPTTVAPVLGGIREFRTLATDVRARGMGLLLDIVPNHLGIASEANRWWFDVLRYGRASNFASFFDVEWEVADPALHGRVLLPVLGAELEDVLRRGELTLEHDSAGFHLRYFDRRFPLDPATALDLDLTAVERLNEERTTPEGAERLGALLDRQHYVLRYWRTGAREVNYRRFFTIDGLVGVRVEDERVFEATHETVLRLVGEGAVTGLRVDHIDGLADPEAYLRRLHDRTGAYVVVEKILAFDEELPQSWRAKGTTGYEFMNDVTGLLVDSANVGRFHEIYAAFTGREEPFADIAYRARRAVIDGPLAQQIDLVATALYHAAGIETRRIDLVAWLGAVRAVLACLPIYRLYATERGPDPEAPRHLATASAEAAARLPDLPREALDAVVDVLARPPSEAALHAVMRLQQLMPAIQAKGVEDAAIYRHVPLLALDEVGSDPERAGLSVEEFHDRSRWRLQRWGGSLLATATHDHKRGEGIRARLAALSELPDEWERTIEAWSNAVRERIEHPPGPDSPSRHDEYTIFQTILGAWPPEGSAPSRDDLVARLTEYTVKALREAGERTNWLDPAEAYEAALAEFVAAATHPDIVEQLLEVSGSLGRRTAWLGALNGLSSTLLKLSVPGVPDIYQGAELWDLSLVDPDNRRPVDYEERAATAERLASVVEDGPEGDRRRAQQVPALLANWTDGAVKLFVLARCLRLRQRLAALFADGDYRQLEVRGTQQSHAIAFERRLAGAAIVAVAALQPAGLLGTDEVATERWDPAWGDTAVVLGPASQGATYVDALSGAGLKATEGGALSLNHVLDVLPVALLEQREADL